MAFQAAKKWAKVKKNGVQYDMATEESESSETVTKSPNVKVRAKLNAEELEAHLKAQHERKKEKREHRVSVLSGVLGMAIGGLRDAALAIVEVTSRAEQLRFQRLCELAEKSPTMAIKVLDQEHELSKLEIEKDHESDKHTTDKVCEMLTSMSEHGKDLLRPLTEKCDTTEMYKAFQQRLEKVTLEKLKVTSDDIGDVTQLAGDAADIANEAMKMAQSSKDKVEHLSAQIDSLLGKIDDFERKPAHRPMPGA